MNAPDDAHHLTQTELERQLSIRQGLVPVSIDPVASRIVWVDLEQFHCYQGFFQDALDAWAAIRRSNPDRFTSSLDVLDSVRIPSNSFAPTGFVFHAGRCGSTLLAQLLARSRENLVFSEALPHNQIWRRQAESASTACRNLFLVMGRRRLPSYRFHIIKFTSFNILKFHQIRAAFPGVPALFLYRDPAAILDSYRRSNPPWMGRELGIGRVLATPESAVEAFFRMALAIADADFQCLDYTRLTPESLPSILTFLRMSPSQENLKLMSEGFSWDAGSGSTPRRFAPRTTAPESASGTISVPDELRELYARLTMWKPLSGA